MWENIASKIYIPYDKERKLIEQFEGYFALEDIPITEYDENQMPIWPDLRGHRLGDTQLVKQADVVMLMLLMGDEFDEEVRKINYEYYEARTMHKSSLSPSMYSIMGLSVGNSNKAYKYFMKTIMTDLEDNQGNAEFGLHAASTGGAWQCAVFGFGGLHVDKEQYLCLRPWIPKHWEEMRFKINWRNAVLTVYIQQDKVIINTSEDTEVKVFDKNYFIQKGKELEVATFTS